MFPNVTEAEMVAKIVADQQQQGLRMSQMEAAITAAQAAGAAATAANAGGTGQGGNPPDFHTGNEEWGGGKGFGKGGYQSLMDEKHFRRVDKFEGNPANLKSWMFDLATVCEYVDHTLARDLKLQIKERPKLNIGNGEFIIDQAHSVHDYHTVGNQKK